MQESVFPGLCAKAWSSPWIKIYPEEKK